MGTREEPDRDTSGREPSIWPRVVRAVLALPFVVTILIPTSVLVFARQDDTRWSFAMPLRLVPLLVGIGMAAAGLVLLVVTIRLFALVGRGTLAAWDPTRKLVIEGPYRHVRNPMISAVLMILVGESVTFGSLILAGFALFFFTLNHTYFLVSEEPGLLARFGDDYREYRRNVPRWIPRLRAWRAESE